MVSCQFQFTRRDVHRQRLPKHHRLSDRQGWRPWARGEYAPLPNDDGSDLQCPRPQTCLTLKNNLQSRSAHHQKNNELVQPFALILVTGSPRGAVRGWRTREHGPSRRCPRRRRRPLRGSHRRSRGQGCGVQPGNPVHARCEEHCNNAQARSLTVWCWPASTPSPKSRRAVPRCHREVVEEARGWQSNLRCTRTRIHNH